ncbi:MAG: hypothetical protein ACYC61_01525 [Isosphaeraceae bacterium]
MILDEYSPPPSPSPAHQRDALRKGLGRAMQWAMTRRLDEGPLLEACLQDLRFDTQLDDSRGDWLWQMIRAVGAADRFRVPILHALYELSDERSANQLCELARHYAAGGDDAFRARLYEIVEQKPIADSPWLGEEEIVRLDGENGFLFAARIRGGQLASREWEWDDAMLVRDAAERFGEQRVNDLLDGASDEAIASFREGWRRHEKGENRQDAASLHREEMRAITIEDILSAAEADEPRFHLFRGWGIHADDVDLETILQHLRGAREPAVIARLLQVFSKRAVPLVDEYLFQLCRHGDEEVRRRAISALEQVEHPLIRDFALAELENGLRAGSVVGLFVRNYRLGDERRILESIEIPDDECELHGLLMDVIEVLKVNPDADCSRLGVLAYALTPCENCRFHAARLLLDRRAAPEWLMEECRYDSGERCRKLATRGEDSTEED